MINFYEAVPAYFLNLTDCVPQGKKTAHEDSLSKIQKAAGIASNVLNYFFFLTDFDFLFSISLTVALAAANLAIGTRNGEQLT